MDRSVARFAVSGPHARVRVTDLAMRDVVRANPRVPVWPDGHDHGPEVAPLGVTSGWSVDRDGLWAEVKVSLPFGPGSRAMVARLRAGQPVACSAEFSILNSRRAESGEAVVGALAVDAVCLLPADVKGAWANARVVAIGSSSGILRQHPAGSALPASSAMSADTGAWSAQTCPPIASGRRCEHHSTDRLTVVHRSREFAY
jgi:hypothetical protein